jgi:hypothetical protein
MMSGNEDDYFSFCEKYSQPVTGTDRNYRPDAGENLRNFFVIIIVPLILLCGWWALTHAESIAGFLQNQEAKK